MTLYVCKYIQPEHHWLFISHCFVKGLHLFLIFWYFGSSIIKKKNCGTLRNTNGPMRTDFLCQGLRFFPGGGVFRKWTTGWRWEQGVVVCFTVSRLRAFRMISTSFSNPLLRFCLFWSFPKWLIFLPRRCFRWSLESHPPISFVHPKYSFYVR